MWTYEQSTGWLYGPSGVKFAQGYSGYGPFKNKPAAESLEALGPIPEGRYLFSAPIDTLKHGKYVLPLIPSDGNVMFGRSEFLVHGDSIEFPGTASKGCVIMPRWARERMWESGDHVLEVTASAVTIIDPEI